jgi:SAM-dependent methyltransferase
MDALGFVSGDLSRFACPRCGAHDRERHLKLYMEASGIAARLSAMRILHFAPEAWLGPWIQSFSPRSYVACDLYPSSPHLMRVDAEAIQFDTGSFDLVIANHVLEHVSDDGKALSEIARVISPGGYAILQTPYSAILERTWEDKGITSPQARLHAYGQEDHVRLYGRDIFSRLATFGFSSRVSDHQKLLPDIDSAHYGVGAAEPFFLFQKES